MAKLTKRIELTRNWLYKAFVVVTLLAGFLVLKAWSQPWRRTERDVDQAVVALATSAATLIAFFVTTVIALQKERRESERSDIELEKLKLENERLRMELETKKDRPGDKPARRRVKLVTPIPRERRNPPVQSVPDAGDGE